MWRALLLIGAFVGTLAAQAPGPAISPRDLAVLLAARQVPAGVIAPTGSMGVGPPPPALPASETTDGLLARFTASMPTYAAAREDRAIHVMPRDLPPRIRERLEQPQDVGFSDTSAVGVVMRLADALRGRMNPGAIAGGAPPGPTCPLSTTVHLPNATASPLQALDEVVTQTKGLVWVVTYDAMVPDLDFAIGLICGGGETVLIEVGH